MAHSIDQRVSDAVRAANIPQRELGEALGLSVTAISDRLRGRTRWSASELPLVAHVVGCTVAELLDEPEPGQLVSVR